MCCYFNRGELIFSTALLLFSGMAEVLFRAKLQREGAQTPWGFRLQGGVEYSKPLTLLKVTENSIASKYGLHAGDIVVKLAGKSAENMTHKDAQQAILSAANDLEIIVERADESIICSGGQEDEKRASVDPTEQVTDSQISTEGVATQPLEDSTVVQNNNNNNTCEDAMKKSLSTNCTPADCSKVAQGERCKPKLQKAPSEGSISPDTHKKTLPSQKDLISHKVKKKTEPNDTGQDGYHSDSVVASLSSDSSAQNNKLSTSQSVIPKSDDIGQARTVLAENVSDKRLKFINWTSSSTSSESDDSISIYVANRERMLPSPVPSAGSHGNDASGLKDSKYPWRRPRSENRDTSLHVRSVSEPARHTLPDDQIGSSHLPKKSVSVANLTQNETGKIKSLKTRTLESVTEECSQDDTAKNSVDILLSKRRENKFDSKHFSDGKSSAENKMLHSNSSPNLEKSNSTSNIAQQTRSSAMSNNIDQDTNKSQPQQDNNSSNDDFDSSKSDHDLNSANIGNHTKEERNSSNSQYLAPTQEDIYFAAADPDLVGISMPTVKSMVANLNNRLELIASEHPKIAQPTPQVELGLTFTSKDAPKSKQEESKNDSEESPVLITNTSEEHLETKASSSDGLSTTDAGLKNNNNNSNKTDRPDVLHTNNTSSLSEASPSLNSPRTPTGDRKVRFADPPESKVIEIEASERRRRRGMERRREDKYPEFYQKKVDDDHQLSSSDKELLMLGETGGTVNSASDEIDSTRPCDGTSNETTDTPMSNLKTDLENEKPAVKPVAECFKAKVTTENNIPSVTLNVEKLSKERFEQETASLGSSDNKRVKQESKGEVSHSFEESKLKIPDIAFTTCSVKELADRLDKIERENELSNLKLRSMRMTREEGDKPLVAMDITGRTYSITPTPVTPKEKSPEQPVTETIPSKTAAKPKYSITVESKPAPVLVKQTSSSNRSRYMSTTPAKSKSISITPSSTQSPAVAKPPPPYYTTIPVSHIQQQPQTQQQLSSPPHQSGNVSPSYQQEHIDRISPVPSINTPRATSPHGQYKMSSPRRSPVQQEELNYYKQRLLPQEAPPPYSALHSYEYYKKLPGAARRNSTGGIMLQTQHLGSGRGFTFSIDSGHGGSGQINVVFSQQQEGADQPTQVAFQIPRGSPMSTYSLSPRDGSPGLSINYQNPPPQQRDSLPPHHLHQQRHHHTLSPPHLTAYHKPGQSFDESKIIHISYPPNTSPQRSLNTSPRPPGSPDYYSRRPEPNHPPQAPQQQRPLFVRTDSPLMRTANSNFGGGEGRRSPYLSPPTPQTHPHLQQHQQQPHSVTYISPGASPILYEDTSNLSQSRSFKNLENKFSQGVPQPVASARPYIPESSSPLGGASATAVPPSFRAYPGHMGEAPAAPMTNYRPSAQSQAAVRNRRPVPSNMDMYALSRSDMENMPPGLFAFFDKSFSERFMQWQNQSPEGYHQSETLRLVKEMDQEQQHYDGAPYL